MLTVEFTVIGIFCEITPTILFNTITGPDSAKAKRAFDAMLEMKEIDISGTERTFLG